MRAASARHRIILQCRRLWTRLSGCRRQPLLSVPLALGVLLPAWWLAGQLYEGNLLLEQRAHVAADLSPHAHALTESFHERFAVLVGLGALVTLAPSAELSGLELDRHAAGLLAGTEGIRSLAIAPGGTVRYVYPPTDGENLLGRRVIEDERPGVREDIQRAIRSRRITLSAPPDLGTAGRDWAAWLAVYGEDEFRGLVTVRVDFAEILRSAGLDEPHAWLQLALRDDAGRVVYGPEMVFDAEPVIQAVEQPEGHWELAAIPRGGWLSSVRDRLRVFDTAGLAIVMLLAYLAYLNSSRHARLARAVEQRTRDLAMVNEELREDISRRQQVEAEREQLLERLEQRVAERTHHLKTLCDVTAVVGGSLDLRDMLERSLDRIVRAMDSELAVMHLRDPREGVLRVAASRGLAHEPCGRLALSPKEAEPDGPCRWMCGNGEPATGANAADDVRTGLAFSRLDVRAHLGLPVRGKGRLMGVLCLFRGADHPFSAEESNLLMAIGEQLGVATENASLFAAAQDRATLEERQRLASELHDSVTQLMYSEMLMAEAVRQMVASGNLAAADQYLGRLGETAQQALKEMRLLLFELRPPEAAEMGLVAALQRRLDAVEKRAGLGVRLLVDSAVDLPPSVEEGLGRIAREALNNTLKHAAATSVTIEVSANGDLIEMRVSDNGRGFDPSSAAGRGGLGLTTMQERVRRLGGSLVIESEPGAGAVVQVKVPLPHEPAGAQGGGCPGDLAKV